MASTQELVAALITQPPDERSAQAMAMVLPWLQRRSQKLMDMERETLMEILQNCSYEKASKDDVIVKQGEKGDNFYIIISGRTSVYIDVFKSDDDPFEERAQLKAKVFSKSVSSEAKLQAAGTGVKRNKTANRDIFGKFISYLETGKTFGEIALLSTDAIRNATVVADEDTDLLVINRSLFDRCVKATEEAIYKEKAEFVSQHKLFRSWSQKLRRLLEMSLKKEVCAQGTVLMRQGQPAPGLIFIISGLAQVCMEPGRHEEQFPELMGASRGHIKNQVPSGCASASARGTTNAQICVRRHQGYAAAERRLMGKHVNLCCVGPNDILGDAEMALGLEKNTSTVTVMEDAHLIVMNPKNFERLVLRKNMQTVRDLLQIVCQKLEARLNSPLASQVPIIRSLHVAAVTLGRHLAGTNVKQGRRVKVRGQARREREMEKTLVRMFLDGHAPLVKPLLSDSLKYRAASLAKMKILTGPFGRAWSLRMSNARPSHRRRKIARSKLQLRQNIEAQRQLLGHTALPEDKRKEDDVTSARPVIRPISASAGTAPCDTSVARYSTIVRPHSAIVLRSASGLQQMVSSAIVRQKSADVAVRSRQRDGPEDDIVQELEAIRQARADSRVRVVCACSDPRAGSHIENSDDGDSDEGKDAFYDWETSDEKLRDLEDRIASFCSGLSPHYPSGSLPAPPRRRPQVTELKRFEVQGSAGTPAPGGVVFVRRTPHRPFPSLGLANNAVGITAAAAGTQSRVHRVVLPRRKSSL